VTSALHAVNLKSKGQGQGHTVTKTVTDARLVVGGPLLRPCAAAAAADVGLHVVLTAQIFGYVCMCVCVRIPDVVQRGSVSRSNGHHSTHHRAAHALRRLLSQQRVCRRNSFKN